jgi:pimeloyl-ACP methyl ester carboxylesterase
MPSSLLTPPKSSSRTGAPASVNKDQINTDLLAFIKGGRDHVDHSHVTVPTHFVEGKGIRFAYRRFGRDSGMTLLFLQHFRGGMDHWDSAVTDGFARDRPVVLFDNAGVAGSSGDIPNTIEAMADHAATFVGALGLSGVDVLGFSIGGYVSQTLALRYPARVRLMILVATGPRGGDPSQDPQAAEYDVLIPTINSYTLSQHIPRAQLIIYPDSGHGALFQFPELFVAHGRTFLEGS